jgi:hypothetical protein
VRNHVDNPLIYHRIGLIIWKWTGDSYNYGLEVFG